MKTSEFIEKVEKLEFIGEVKENNDEIKLISYTDRMIIRLYNNAIGQIDTTWEYFEKLNYSEKKEILSIVYEYVLTPIEERKNKTIEEKAREYIKACVNSDCDFFIIIKGLEEDYIRIEDGLARTTFMYKETKANADIYEWYKENSNEFIKMWSEVSNND